MSGSVRHDGRWLIACLLAMGACAASSARAQDQPPPAPEQPTSAPLEFTITAGAWMPRLKGQSTLGLGNTPIDLEFDFDLNNPEAIFRGEFELRKAEIWELHFNALDFSTSTIATFPIARTFGAVDLAPGDSYIAAVDMQSFAVEFNVGAYRPFKLTPPGNDSVDLRLSPQFGARWVDVEQRVSEPGVASDMARGEWFAPYAGVYAEMTWDAEPLSSWLDLFEMQAGVTFGPAFGGDGGFIWAVRGGITLHFSRHVGLHMGYRLLELSVENEDFNFEGGLQGLFVAGTITF